MITPRKPDFKPQISPNCHASARQYSVAWLLLLAAVAAFFGVWSYTVPIQADDIAFQYFLPHFEERNSSLWGAFWEYSHWFWLDTNGRLANFVAPLATMYVPRWLFASLTGVATAWVMYAAIRLAQWRRTADPRFNFCALLMMMPVVLFLWPWRDYLLYPDYSLNYLYSTALNLIFLIVWLRALERWMPLWWLVWALPLTIVTGMMHEGLSLPMLGACGLVTILRRLRIPPAAWALGLVYLAGTLVVTLSPGILGRAAREHGGTSILVHGYYTLIYCTLLWAMIITAMVLLWRRTSRRRMAALLRTPVFATAALNALAGAAICFIFDEATPRYGWLTQVFSTIALLQIWREFAWRSERCKRRLLMWGAAAGLLTAIPAGLTVADARAVAREDRLIRHKLESLPDGTFYFDVSTAADASPLIMGNTFRGMWKSHFQHACYNLGLSVDEARAVVPVVLKGFRFASPLPGNAHVARISGYLIGDVIPRKIEGLEFRATALELTLDDGSRVTRYFAAYPFRAGGRTYFLYGPERLLPPDVRSIDFPENEKLNKFVPLPE